MSYTQRFGLSRKSPFNNVDETDKKDTAKQQAVSKTPSNDVFGELEYKMGKFRDDNWKRGDNDDISNQLDFSLDNKDGAE